MQRWWDSAEAARDALGRVDDSDVQMGVGTALLGYHAIAKEALEPLASQTLVDPALIEAYLDGIDLEPVAKAISAAARAALPQAEADRYGWLMATNTHHQALAATPRLATALVAKGTSWPKAMARAAEIVGVPLNRLGRYPDEVSKAGLDSLSVSDAADRSLMTWAAAISGSVPLEPVSKRGRERERGHEPEKEKFDESEVKRDEHGRFAEEADHQQRIAREARKRRKARRQRRQAASQAAEKPQAAKAKERVQSKVKARAMGKARPVTASQARALVASSARERPRQMMELDEARRAEEMDLPDDTGAFGLKKKGTHWTIWDDDTLGTDYYPTFTTAPVDPNEAQMVMDSNDLLKALGGPEAFHGQETFAWDRNAAMAILGFDDDTPENEIEAGIAGLPPVTLLDYDPNQHTRHLYMSHNDLVNFDQFYFHEAGALPMRRADDRRGSPELLRQTATLDELPAGSIWETDDTSVLSTSVANTNWVDQDGRAHNISFDFPSIRQYHTANGVKKAERSRTRERPHSNAPERWDETQVKRDEQGQFAAEGTAEQKQAVEDRAARKRRRNKRRARQAAFAEAKAQTKAKERPKEKARERVRGKARAFVSGKARERNKQLVHGRSLTQVQSRQTTSDEFPLGLTMHIRSEAPDKGPYTLDEPLYTMQVADGTTPQLVMTEDEMTQSIRSKLTVGTRSAKTVNAYGEKIQSWPEPGGHNHPPIIRRYEPGTLPIGGRNPQGTFFTASDDQINQQWESAPYSGEGPSEIDFMVAAPGDQYDRRPKKVTVMVENVITTFTKADVAKAKERERTAQNSPERWDETKVKRDEQGQFAAEQSDEAKAARVRRKARKARRAKRAARAAAWKERNAPAPAKERTASAVKARAQAKARERVQAAVQSAERLRPARGRAMSKVAERALHEETPPDMEDWLKALLNPQATGMGEFLGQAGYKPYTTTIDINRLAAYAPMAADNLHAGLSVGFADLWHELDDDRPIAPSQAYSTIMRPTVSKLGPNVQKDIHETTVKILGDAFDQWQPVDGGAAYLEVGDTESHLRHKPDSGSATILDQNGKVYEGMPYLSQMGKPARPIVVGMQAAITLRQIEALISIANGTGSTAKIEELATEGWKKIHATSAFGTPPLSDDPVELRQTAVDLMTQQELAIHPIDDHALEETARLAMSKQKESEVRLDNRGVFLITSRLETKNGWDRAAELKEKR